MLRVDDEDEMTRIKKQKKKNQRSQPVVFQFQ